MKKLFGVLLLWSCTAVAGDRYIIIAMRDDASTADKIKVRDKIKELPQINWHNIDRMADMPQWRTVANTNITWRVLFLDADKTRSEWPKITVTKDQYEAWKSANLAAPEKVQVRTSSGDVQQTLRDAGLEPVPVEREGP